MTYVNKKLRVFENVSGAEIYQQRSDGRMKTYQSATDVRSWCNASEERRQYILDLFKRDNETTLSTKKHTPIGTIINILLANKNAKTKPLPVKFEQLKKLPSKDFNSFSKGLARINQKKEYTKGEDLSLLKNVKKKRKSTGGDALANNKDIILKQIHLNLLKMSQKNEDRNSKREELKKIQRRNKLKEKIEKLEIEKEILLNKIRHCESHLNIQKKKISTLTSHVDYLKYQRRKPRKSSASFSSSIQQVNSQPSFINRQKMQAYYLGMRAQTELELTNKIKNGSNFSHKNFTETRKKSVTHYKPLAKIGMLHNIGDHFRSKLDVEKQKCNDIFNRYTNTVANMKLKIDIIKNASHDYTRNKHKFFRNTSKNIFSKEDEIFPYSCRNMNIQRLVRRKFIS